MQKDRAITNELTDEKEYVKMLVFCAKHDLICYEFYYRNGAQKNKKKQKKGSTAL